IVRPLKRDSAAQRLHNKFLSSIHDAILEDLIVTTEIVRNIMKDYLTPRNKTTPSISWRPFQQFTESFQVKILCLRKYNA
ncbi:hypothetical protein MTR67_040594, partial [Solanum verrucosum]